MISYFVPGSIVEPTHETLVAAGLGHAFDADTPIHSAPMQDGTGPAKKAGRIVSRNDSGVQFTPDQKWVEMQGTNGLMMGWRDLPTPESLERKTKLAPAFVLTEYCGEKWKLPQVRYFSDEGTIQATSLFEYTATFDGKDFRSGEVVKKFKEAQRLSQLVLDVYTGKANEAEQKSPLLIAADIIALNYHVSGHELAALGAMKFDSEYVTVFDVLVDWQTYLDLKKKRALNSVDSEHGKKD